MFAPADRRMQFVRQAEKLHDVIDPHQTYPLDFVTHRITGYHAEQDADMLLVGEAMLPDLRRVIDELSRSVRMIVSPGDGVASIEDVADRLNVSTKTVRRWRDKGLRWRWVIFAGQKRRKIGICDDAVEHFLQSHEQLVSFAGQFQHISDEQRQAIIDRARRIASAVDVSLNRVAQHLADKYGRALETVRQILEQHDRRHPDNPIFANRTGPLTVRQRRLIARAYRMGVPVSKLARRFGRTRSTIYRAINRRRASALRRRPFHFIASPTFERDDADEVLLGDNPMAEPITSVSAAPVGDLAEAMQPIFRQPLLPHARQHRIAVQMNYLLFKAARLRDGLDRYEPRAADMDTIEDCLERADAMRRRLIRTSLPTVLTVTRQHLSDAPQFGHKQGLLMELLESGVTLMIDAIGAFDPFRGRTLDRHLNWTLMRRFAKSVAAEPAMAAWARKATGRAQRRDESQAVARRIRKSLLDAGIDVDTLT